MAKRKTQADQMVERLEAKRREVQGRYDLEVVSLTKQRDAELAGINASIEAVKAQPTRKRRLKAVPEVVAKPA